MRFNDFTLESLCSVILEDNSSLLDLGLVKWKVSMAMNYENLGCKIRQCRLGYIEGGELVLRTLGQPPCKPGERNQKQLQEHIILIYDQ